MDDNIADVKESESDVAVATAIEDLEDDDEILYCQWHPKVETTLRCYQCGTPMCVKCAKHTPVGYLCPACVRGRQKRFITAKSWDYVIAGVVALVLGGIAAFIPMIGWFTMLLSPMAGGLIGEAVWRLVGRRYGEHLWWIAAVGIVVGSLPLLLPTLLDSLFYLSRGHIGGALNLLWFGIHLVLVIGSATARLRLS
jgi:hypothetical protein